MSFLNGYESDRQTVKYLVKKHYNSLPMRLRFEFPSQRNIYSSDIRIEFANHSSSYIGRQAEGYPGQATMWLNMYPRMHAQEAARDKVQADVLHEFEHALGLVHEHKHPGCGATWNYGALMGKNGWGLSMVRRNYDANTQSALATLRGDIQAAGGLGNSGTRQREQVGCCQWRVRCGERQCLRDHQRRRACGGQRKRQCGCPRR